MAEIKLTHSDIHKGVHKIAAKIQEACNPENKIIFNIYPVPRGGIPVAYHLLQHFPNGCIVDQAVDADVIVDDILDSGSTFDHYRRNFPGIPFFAMFDKNWEFPGNPWIIFPWETNRNGEVETIESNITRIIEYVGENPSRGGLLETPKRVAKAWKEWCSGYEMKPADILKIFDDGGENYDQMIVVKDIPFYSHCEHHLAPFFGDVTIAYIPAEGRIVGLSKLSRIVDCFAKRLQVQERLTDQIADALMEHLNPLGVGVRIKARHLCMESRGICKQGHHTKTTSIRGVIKNDSKANSEFLEILR